MWYREQSKCFPHLFDRLRAKMDTFNQDLGIFDNLDDVSFYDDFLSWDAQEAFNPQSFDYIFQQGEAKTPENPPIFNPGEFENRSLRNEITDLQAE